MANDETIRGPSQVEPILAVRDVKETLLYWHNVLGFTDKWTWGEPPDYGGVSWNGVSIQFSQNPERATASKGNAIFIRVRNLESLYQFHQDKNVEIVEPLENKPWGMAGYTVREINGYYIVFAGTVLSDKDKSSAELPPTVSIIERLPSVKEYQHLASSVGWSLYLGDAVVERLLSAPVFAVVAADTITNYVIGCALVLGDHASFYYVKDLIVHPDWQAKHVGTAMMKVVTRWLEENAANKSLVTLITGENLAPFYQQFGFTPAFGMVRHIEHGEKGTE